MIALFTGAGASAAFGFPLTSEIMPRILKMLRDSSTNRQRAELHHFIQQLFPGLGEPGVEPPLITDLLSMIDSAVLSENALGHRVGHATLRRFRRMLGELIYLALEWHIDYGNSTEDRRHARNLDAVARWLRRLYDLEHPFGIVSTNYDIALEWSMRGDGRALHAISDRALAASMDLGFDWRDPDSGEVARRPVRPRFFAYKLHGSIDLLRCPLCDHVYFNRTGTIIHLAMGEVSHNNTCHCEYAPLEAVMVTPSLVRDIRDSTLLEIWRHALEFLRNADHWVFAGYSFPREDVAIRTLISRALLGRDEPPRITIVQRGAKRETLGQYRLMFPHCAYENGGMESLIEAVSARPDPSRALTDYAQRLPEISEVTPED